MFCNKCKLWNDEFRQAAGGENNEGTQSLFLRLGQKKERNKKKREKKERAWRKKALNWKRGDGMEGKPEVFYTQK